MKDTRRTSYFPIQGGEDLSLPPMSMPPGKCLFALNYECDDLGRMRRIDGYERFDGHDSPSDAGYWYLPISAGEHEPTEGETITGGTSSATGEYIDSVLSSGTYAGSDAVGYIVLTSVSGTFQSGEELTTTGPVTIATTTDVAEYRGGVTAVEDLAWISSAVELARDKIGPVDPTDGVGDILGVWEYDDTVYAFRGHDNDADGVADEVLMWKSSATGWTEVDLGYTLPFDTGSAEVVEGEEITGGTSGAVATVQRVVVSSGTWTGGTAAGYFVITTATGTFEAEAVTGDGTGAANVTADKSAITLSTGGYFEFDNFNFYGNTTTYRMYGCDGVNPPFEFDGTVFAPIETGMGLLSSPIYPDHIKAHKHHLFVSYTGGSLQFSGVGEPLKWDASDGAGEIGIGNEITGLVSLPNVLGIFTEDSVNLLYGTELDSFELRLLSDIEGATEKTVQRPGTFLGKGGVTIMAPVQEYGDFGTKLISTPIKPYLDRKSTYSSSVVSQAKSSYRLFFPDKEGINLTIKNGKVIGFTRLKYDHAILCTSSANRLFFGSEDGYVFEMDKGTSFDGDSIDAFLRTAYNHFKTPQHKKRFFKLVLEMEGRGTLYFSQDYTYGDEQILTDTEGYSYTIYRPQGYYQAVDIFAGGGAWDVDNWNEFVWSGPLIESAEAWLDGSGLNMAITIASTGTYEEPHTIQGAIVHYSIRGMQR